MRESAINAIITGGILAAVVLGFLALFANRILEDHSAQLQAVSAAISKIEALRHETNERLTMLAAKQETLNARVIELRASNR